MPFINRCIVLLTENTKSVGTCQDKSQNVRDLLYWTAFKQIANESPVYQVAFKHRSPALPISVALHC